jgi:hypothetical protein
MVQSLGTPRPWITWSGPWNSGLYNQVRTWNLHRACARRTTCHLSASYMPSSRDELTLYRSFTQDQELCDIPHEFRTVLK